MSLVRFWFGKKRSAQVAPEEPLVRLCGLLHIHARRGIAEDGFQLSTRLLSASRCQVFSRNPLQPGEELKLKIVSGAYVIDVKGRVESVAPLQGEQFAGFIAMITFIQPSDFDRRIIANILCRLGLQAS